MAEENAPGAKVNEEPGGIKVEVNKMFKRNTLWWAILAVYLLLFASTGYLAFLRRDVNPVLRDGSGGLAQQIPDEETRTFVMNALQDEATEHEKKDSLVLQSFNVVLGSLLGFLSASAASRGSEKGSA
jgi:hypothetical protein